MGEEEALVCSGSLVVEAVRCELRSMMLDHGWRCLGENIYVNSKFDQNEERTDLCAVNVVQCFCHFFRRSLLHVTFYTNKCHVTAPELEISTQSNLKI